VIQHAVDSLEVFFGLIVELFRLLFELLKSPFCVNKYGIFCIITQIKALFERLRRLIDS
jgi:hypothetical protein